VIEPVPLPSSEPDPPAEEQRVEPVVLEDLVALIRLPNLFQKLDRVLNNVRALYQAPEEYPFQLIDPQPGDGMREYGLSWVDEQRLIRVFAGITWGNEGHDPIWEVRVEALPPLDPEKIRGQGMHRIAARRAESRFSEWDRFWHDEDSKGWLLFGTSASCTRFFEEENPDHTAAIYLSSALYALQSSGALQAILAVAQEPS